MKQQRNQRPNAVFKARRPARRGLSPNPARSRPEPEAYTTPEIDREDLTREETGRIIVAQGRVRNLRRQFREPLPPSPRALRREKSARQRRRIRRRLQISVARGGRRIRSFKSALAAATLRYFADFVAVVRAGTRTVTRGTYAAGSAGRQLLQRIGKALASGGTLVVDGCVSMLDFAGQRMATGLRSIGALVRIAGGGIVTLADRSGTWLAWLLRASAAGLAAAAAVSVNYAKAAKKASVLGLSATRLAFRSLAAHMAHAAKSGGAFLAKSSQSFGAMLAGTVTSFGTMVGRSVAAVGARGRQGVRASGQALRTGQRSAGTTWQSFRAFLARSATVTTSLCRKTGVSGLAASRRVAAILFTGAGAARAALVRMINGVFQAALRAGAQSVHALRTTLTSCVNVSARVAAAVGKGASAFIAGTKQSILMITKAVETVYARMTRGLVWGTGQMIKGSGTILRSGSEKVGQAARITQKGFGRSAGAAQKTAAAAARAAHDLQAQIKAGLVQAPAPTEAAAEVRVHGLRAQYRVPEPPSNRVLMLRRIRVGLTDSRRFAKRLYRASLTSLRRGWQGFVAGIVATVTAITNGVLAGTRMIGSVFWLIGVGIGRGLSWCVVAVALSARAIIRGLITATVFLAGLIATLGNAIIETAVALVTGLVKLIAGTVGMTVRGLATIFHGTRKAVPLKRVLTIGYSAAVIVALLFIGRAVIPPLLEESPPEEINITQRSAPAPYVLDEASLPFLTVANRNIPDRDAIATLNQTGSRGAIQMVEAPLAITGAIVPTANPAHVPAWLANAVPGALVSGRPQVVIIIDDLGLDPRRTRALAVLQGPLNFSFLPYATRLKAQAALAHSGGHELMVHMPMEPKSATEDPGPNALLTTLDEVEFRRRLTWNLERFPGYVGINNHMGSALTEDSRAMEIVVSELSRRGLLYVDSFTSARTVGIKLAKSHGVPYSGRDVFLDNTRDVEAILAQLAKVEKAALRSGVGVAIGHPYPQTIRALTEWLPTLEARGFDLAPVSAIVKTAGGDEQRIARSSLAGTAGGTR